MILKHLSASSEIVIFLDTIGSTVLYRQKEEESKHLNLVSSVEMENEFPDVLILISHFIHMLHSKRHYKLSLELRPYVWKDKISAHLPYPSMAWLNECHNAQALSLHGESKVG